MTISSSGDHSDKDSLPFIMDLQISSQNSYKSSPLIIGNSTSSTTTGILNSTNNNNNNTSSRAILIQANRKRYQEDDEISREDDDEEEYEETRDDGVEVLSESTLIINESYSNNGITPEMMERNILSLKNSPIQSTVNSLNITPIKSTEQQQPISLSNLLEQQNQQQPSTIFNVINTINNSTNPTAIGENLLENIKSQSVEIGELFSYFRKYKATFHGKREEELYKYQSIVNSLFEKDYVISTINNKDGELCATYPPELIVIERELNTQCQQCKEKDKDKLKFSSNGHHHHHHNGNGNTTEHTHHLQKLISQSRFARVRTRFPFPVIFYHHKNICRSSTLSQKLEYMLQSGVNSMKKQFASTVIPSISPTISASTYTNGSSNSSNNNISQSICTNNNMGESTIIQPQLQLQLLQNDNLLNSSVMSPDDLPNPPVLVHQPYQQQQQQQDDGAQNMDILRNKDILVIRHLNVRYICDLMVENKKKKFGFFVCSSEKVDMHKRYQDFVIASTPYPGVEFFAEFSKNKHNGHDLVYQWDSTEDPAELNIHPDYSLHTIPWEQYKTWDLIYLTQNYFKLLLKYISDDSNPSGLLVHCISGWDRTPLFVSLIRISLWADGEAHNSLEPWEMLVLTVAYDWFLFSHQLSDRASRGEDIFYFCFYFLEYITSMDFSVHHFTKNVQSQQQSQPQQPQNVNLKENIKQATTTNSNLLNNNNRQYQPTNTKLTNNNNVNFKNNKPNCNSNNNISSYPTGSSWGKSHLDISQSAPVTPLSNSPKIFIGLNKIQNNNNTTSNSASSSYISAPSTPLSNPLIIDKNSTNNFYHNGSFQKVSPSLAGSSIPVDVPNGIKKRRGSEEEIGGSWQLMGSFTEKKSSCTNSLGSTPKAFQPSSFNSASEHSEPDDDDIVQKSTHSTKMNTITSEDEEDDYSSDMLTFSFEHDTNKHFESIIKNNHQKQQQQQQQQQTSSNNTTTQQTNNDSKKHTHNSQHLSPKEIEERRKKRLLELRNLFFHFYQNHCSTNSESDWKSILISYLPKFG
ncbi:hypothetical protein DLAC_06841 [Tieghemostelium lacteum]|uniref:Tyrosine specific protein phosphatases domain-containing protein n=1 Tax=Tieghemostelium lacteum TaxID=361077 RepID=A0A151ZDK9_TIELA|nr:hypothetical protein DLAC_06841 [Tieghemostelium lacteum]|eukprot:KYQ92015.1 hypothetical protein DLAC_06841 [Tieghemostelium lacteum]